MYYYYQHAHKNTIIASFKKRLIMSQWLVHICLTCSLSMRHKSMRGFCQERAINANIAKGGAAAEKVSIYIY